MENKTAAGLPHQAQNITYDKKDPKLSKTNKIILNDVFSTILGWLGILF